MVQEKFKSQQMINVYVVSLNQPLPKVLKKPLFLLGLKNISRLAKKLAIIEIFPWFIPLKNSCFRSTFFEKVSVYSEGHKVRNQLMLLG